MHAPRTARHLARLILAWFVVALGVAAASPVLHPQRMEQVCTAGGQVQWVPADGTAAAPLHHTLECPLCLAPAPPPTAARAAMPRLAASADVPRPTPGERAVALARAPFPPRAPPARG